MSQGLPEQLEALTVEENADCILGAVLVTALVVFIDQLTDGMLL